MTRWFPAHLSLAMTHEQLLNNLFADLVGEFASCALCPSFKPSRWACRLISFWQSWRRSRGWSQVLRSFRQLNDLPGSALHAQVLRVNVHDARLDPSCSHWAAGVHKKNLSLGMQLPFARQAGVGAFNPLIFRQKRGGEYKRVWADLHVSPRTAPSAGPKSCTYLCWFAKMPEERYFELPNSLSKLRRLMQFRLGSHGLPIEQSRLARRVVHKYLRRCTLCA